MNQAKQLEATAEEGNPQMEETWVPSHNWALVLPIKFPSFKLYMSEKLTSVMPGPLYLWRRVC